MGSLRKVTVPPGVDRRVIGYLVAARAGLAANAGVEWALRLPASRGGAVASAAPRRDAGRWLAREAVK